MQDQKSHADVEAMFHLNPRQKARVRFWMDLQTTLNAGKFGGEMDVFFHPEMTYGNPSRPDLGSYLQWKTSPEELYKRFPPSRYSTLAATASSDDQIWVHCHHYGRQVGRYMGVEPRGQTINVEWFSTVTFRDDLIFRIFSIADVLGMLLSVGVVPPATLPIDPYN